MSTRPKRSPPCAPNTRADRQPFHPLATIRALPFLRGLGNGTMVGKRLRRACALFFSLIILMLPVSPGHAAGAMAVGSCAAYGFAYDYGNADEARGAALQRCNGKNCSVVATIRRG